MKPTKKPRAVKGELHTIVKGRSTDVVWTDGFGAAGFVQEETVYVVNAAWMREHRAMKRELVVVKCLHKYRPGTGRCTRCAHQLTENDR